MIEVLAAHKRELAKELQERVQTFFEENSETPGSVSVEMEFTESGQGSNLSTIQILVKDAQTGVTLMTV